MPPAWVGSEWIDYAMGLALLAFTLTDVWLLAYLICRALGL
jgi:hypothetical protein